MKAIIGQMKMSEASINQIVSQSSIHYKSYIAPLVILAETTHPFSSLYMHLQKSLTTHHQIKQ